MSTISREAYMRQLLGEVCMCLRMPDMRQFRDEPWANRVVEFIDKEWEKEGQSAPSPEERLDAWAKKHNIQFVHRSYGQYSAGTISREALLELFTR